MRIAILILGVCEIMHAQGFRSRDEARRTMASLLKIAVEAPQVKATERASRTEQGLTISDISWQSADGENVPAWVIRPAGKGPFPAVICLHGTGGSRDSETTLQFGNGEWRRPTDVKPHMRMLGWARELARRGYLTISITQRGLDARLPDTNDRAKDALVHGKTVMGQIVDEIRQSTSYLLTRPDVDAKRIAISGMSFGGITAFYTWLVDHRILAAAPICGGVGSVESLLRQGKPSYHGFYWWVPEMLTKGDQGEFAAAMAPRPLMLWAPLDDIGMPAGGVSEFVKKVAPAYAKGGFVAHRLPGEHAFTLEAFSALVEFLDKHVR